VAQNSVFHFLQLTTSSPNTLTNIHSVCQLLYGPALHSGSPAILQREASSTIHPGSPTTILQRSPAAILLDGAPSSGLPQPHHLVHHHYLHHPDDHHHPDHQRHHLGLRGPPADHLAFHHGHYHSHHHFLPRGSHYCHPRPFRPSPATTKLPCRPAFPSRGLHHPRSPASQLHRRPACALGPSSLRTRRVPGRRGWCKQARARSARRRDGFCCSPVIEHRGFINVFFWIMYILMDERCFIFFFSYPPFYSWR